jgi:haloacetate dehalogenase
MDLFQGFESGRADLGGLGIHYRVGGNGPPLLLLHGYPQTHVMWHKVGPALSRYFTVVCPDLRGYGDSDKPTSDDTHAAYSKRAMAEDQAGLMRSLGFDRFCVAGHDRGGRVTHRLTLDHPNRVTAAAVLDIVPTRTVFHTTDQRLATAYYHWFFLIQPDGLPERMIGADPDYYLTEKLERWGRTPDAYDPAAVSEYLRCFRRADTVRATCEDYRAAASIDLVHDEQDIEHRIQCPLLVLWGTKGLMEALYDVPATWRDRAVSVTAEGISCGHFLPEEAPTETATALKAFFETHMD